MIVNSVDSGIVITNTSTSTGAASTTSTATNVAAGTKLNLKNVALYSSSSASTKTSTKTGTFYAWSKEVVNNKIRITNSSANVGKAGQVTGWINYDDAKKSVVTTTTATATTATVKSLDDWAKEVIKGLYGNGVANRTAALKKAGCPYTYEQVQKRVEQLL